MLWKARLSGWVVFTHDIESAVLRTASHAQWPREATTQVHRRSDSTVPTSCSRPDTCRDTTRDVAPSATHGAAVYTRTMHDALHERKPKTDARHHDPNNQHCLLATVEPSHSFPYRPAPSHRPVRHCRKSRREPKRSCDPVNKQTCAVRRVPHVTGAQHTEQTVPYRLTSPAPLSRTSAPARPCSRCRPLQSRRTRCTPRSGTGRAGRTRCHGHSLSSRFELNHSVARVSPATHEIYPCRARAKGRLRARHRHDCAEVGQGGGNGDSDGFLVDGGGDRRLAPAGEGHGTWGGTV